MIICCRQLSGKIMSLLAAYVFEIPQAVPVKTGVAPVMCCIMSLDVSEERVASIFRTTGFDSGGSVFT